MKKYLALIFIAFHFASYSQNWLPLNKFQKSNYSFGDSVISFTAWVDSTSIPGNDTLFYLNKTIIPCTNCSLPYLWVNSVYLKDQPSYLTSYFYLRSDTLHFINTKWNLHYIIDLACPAGVPFVFDSLNTISAELILETDSSFWDTNDSIKLYVLSNQDTIILSKNHGILKFPTFDTNEQITLVGIEGLNKGILTPKFADFFNFNIGDKFEYAEREGARFISMDLTEQILIKNKISFGDTISYGVERKKINYAYLYNVPMDTLYSIIEDTLTFVHQDYQFLDKFVGEGLHYPECGMKYKPVYLIKNDMFQCVCKTYDADLFLEQSNDTIYVTLAPALYHGCGTLLNSVTYGVGIGPVDIYSDENTGIYSSYHYRKLKAAQIGGITFGVFTPDSIINSIDNGLVHGHPSIFKIYPNPATNKISILNEGDINGEIRISIFNINGESLKQEKFKNQDKIEIDLSMMEKGIYVVKIQTKEGIESKKLVIQKN